VCCFGGVTAFPAGPEWAEQVPRLSMTFSSIRWRLVLGLAIAILLDTGVQIFWKVGVIDLPDDAPLHQLLNSIFERPVFLIVGALMLAQLFNWLSVLSMADLSFAKPFTSLSYVTVGAVAVFVFDEHPHFVQVLGVGVIILGVWFVSRSEPVSS
jgi:drug/metabolite transporter (DMT)-like permease